MVTVTIASPKIGKVEITPPINIQEMILSCPAEGQEAFKSVVAELFTKCCHAVYGTLMSPDIDQAVYDLESAMADFARGQIAKLTP